MITVEKFLCFKLETGGLVIGWFSLVGYVMSIVFSIIGFAVLCIYDCDDLIKILKEKGESVENQFEEACSMGRGVLITVCVIIAAISVGFAIIAYLCIKGTENRDHVRVKPMMIMLAIAAILSFVSALNLTVAAIVSGILYGVIYSFLFVVLYSLYEKFKQEHERGFTPQYHTPAGKV